ncbi:MAG: CrcB family protein [Gammaproteobacteria bacterium]|nr:CrcB family protein [Gammaproteobacteria bacterium]
MMPLWIWVALGSAAGGVARYAIARLWPTVPGGWPLATMAVNVVGSFAIGWLSALLASRAAAGGATETLRVFLMTGVLGGFTTYSAFALETVTLGSSGEMLRAAAYVVVTVVLCLAAALAGRALGPG